MKIVKLLGGLGNQMFQYAFGQLLENDVYYDLSWFEYSKNSKNVTHRNYELDFFDIQIKKLTRKQAKKYKKDNKFLSLFGVKTCLRKIIEHPTNIYNPNLLKEKEGIFEGFFQCAQYYEPIREKLLKDFIPKNEINLENKKILEQILSTNSVSLHVRRGDYLKLQNIHGLCDVSYYEKAIEHISNHTKEPHFFLFSDDIEWVKENLKMSYPYTIVDINHGDKSPWDMWLMKHCKHNIIANSSFSWWGAWLNENPNKIVIAPQKWTVNNNTDIIPSNWERI